MLRDVDINGEFSTNQLQKLEDLGVSDRIGEKLCHWVDMEKASLTSPACGGFLWIFPDGKYGVSGTDFTLADVHLLFSNNWEDHYQQHMGRCYTQINRENMVKKGFKPATMGDLIGSDWGKFHRCRFSPCRNGWIYMDTELLAGAFTP